MSFLNYESYQVTDALLFPEIPSDWKLLTFKHLMSGVESGTSVNATDLPVETDEQFGVLKTSCVYSGEFRPDENKTVFIEELERVTCPVQADTLIVSRMNTPDLVGAAGYSATAITNIFLPDRLWQVTFKLGYAKFVHWFSKTSAYRDQIKLVCAGTSASMQNISQDDFRNILVTAPSVSEARQIAHFLDHEVGKIDALIAEQEKLIALLKEKRQAVISHAVTKGLNPDAPMKDSGVEWLGQVPAHWVVKKLGYIGEAIIGLTYSPDDISDTGVLVLRSSNVQSGRLSFEDNVFVDKVIPEKLRTQQNDILICSRNGSRELIGKNALIDESAVGQTFGAFMTVFRSDVNFYLSQVFNSHIFSAQAGSFMTSTVNQLTTGNLNSFLVPIPPLQEMREIASHLNRVREEIDELIIESSTLREVLTERRSALISAAVTGKIDVRGWQPPAAQ